MVNNVLIPKQLRDGKEANKGYMNEELSKAEKQAKAKKILAMFAGGQWKLVRGIFEAVQDQHWLFEELLDKCDIEKWKLKPSMLIKKAFPKGESAKAELVMLEVLLNLPTDLAKWQCLRKELGIQIRENMLTKYWEDEARDEFEGVMYGDPGFFPDWWHEEKKAEIVRVEQESEAKCNALKKSWKKEEDLGKDLSLETILIPAGQFLMGDPDKNRKVTLTKPFYIGKYTVTQEQWKAMMGDNPSYRKNAKSPVTNVSWYDCKKFINKLNGVTKMRYRLPTEAEWEYACRAGTTTAYSFGPEITPQCANYSDSKIGKPIAVGSYKPNAFGLYDMHGNVWEWCEDRYGEFTELAVTDPKGASKGERRLLRGGSFFANQLGARSSLRSSADPSIQGTCDGFRLARTAE